MHVKTTQAARLLRGELREQGEQSLLCCDGKVAHLQGNSLCELSIPSKSSSTEAHEEKLRTEARRTS